MGPWSRFCPPAPSSDPAPWRLSLPLSPQRVWVGLERGEVAEALLLAQHCHFSARDWGHAAATPSR